MLLAPNLHNKWYAYMVAHQCKVAKLVELTLVGERRLLG